MGTQAAASSTPPKRPCAGCLGAPTDDLPIGAAISVAAQALTRCPRPGIRCAARAAFIEMRMTLVRGVMPGPRPMTPESQDDALQGRPQGRPFFSANSNIGGSNAA